MSTEYSEANLTQIRDTIARLQTPIPDLASLYALLAAPLNAIGLLPPRFRRYDSSPISAGSFVLSRHIPPLQRALLEHIVPTWAAELTREDTYDLVQQYFCPDLISFASPSAGQVALMAYSAVLSMPFTDHSVLLLEKLCQAYPVDVMHSIFFSSAASEAPGRQTTAWEDCIRNIVAIPAKVANFRGERRDIPSALEHGTYFNNVSSRCEHLIFKLAARGSRQSIASVVYLLTKLAVLGIFPASVPSSPAQPSFFQRVLPTIRERLAPPEALGYAAFWQDLIAALPSSQALRSILSSLFASLDRVDHVLDGTPSTRARVKTEGILLRRLLGSFNRDSGDLIDCFDAVALVRSWDEGHARIFICWAAADSDEEGPKALLSSVVDIWTTPDHIRHSLLSQHRYLTALLLLTLSHFPPNSAPYAELALSPAFISAISTYISHLDPAVRRCGMLVAEEVARGAGKNLDFGQWDGDEPGEAWCRQVRELVKARDVDADENILATPEPGSAPQAPAAEPERVDEGAKMPLKVTTGEPSGYDSDDSLMGYASPGSSRSASPTPSELEEIERDPSLNVGIKKVARPVYLAQLGEMVRSTGGTKGGDEQMDAIKVEVALEVAEELIRRKSGYGTELEENAVNLVYGFVGLQDNYDLDGFSEKRQAALNALVACCPHKAAPTIIEQFFQNQYSTEQRFAMLTALAFGARELASLPVPDLPNRPAISAAKVAFPSKRLPAARHNKYLVDNDVLNAHNPVQLLVEHISKLAIENGVSSGDRVPEIARERNLRIRQPAKVSEVAPGSAADARTQLLRQQLPQRAPFHTLAAEHFIAPLVNRFWLFLRDEQAREARTAHQPALHRYSGAGTGLILSALVLARVLETLAVLVHAAQNAREWLAVVAPDALELALALGTRRLSLHEGRDVSTEEGSEGGKEAALLTAALELALIVLDGCLERDGGRSLGLEHTALLLGAGEWAGKVFGALEAGAKALGGGGAQEVRLRRAAAGVVVKVDELTSRWRQSMVSLDWS